MMPPANRADTIIALLQSSAASRSIAEQFEVTEEEVDRWRLLLRGAAPVRPVRSLWRTGVTLAASLGTALVGAFFLFSTGHAGAQATCTDVLPAPMVSFCAGLPARADDVNGNFQYLVDRLGAKAGPIDEPGIRTSSVNVTGNAFAEGALAAGSPTFTPRTGDVVAARDLVADGDVVVGDEIRGQRLSLDDNATINGELRADNARIDGRLTWRPRLSDEERAEVSGGPNRDTTPLGGGNRFCFLTRVEFEDIDSSNEFAGCEVHVTNGAWRLEAVRRTAGSDSTANCRARCVLFE